MARNIYRILWGTHVAKTGDIKDLVIIEESGIAKGIRRIVAVTGHDAHHVQKVANEFEQEIDNASSLPFGVAKESKSKELGVALKNYQFPCWINKD